MINMLKAFRPLLSDLASSILFAAVLGVTGNIYIATGAGIAVGVGQALYQLLRRLPVALMQWMSLALVVIFGSLTIYLHDPRFVIVKFTIVHLAIGAVMLTPNWMSRYLPKIVTETLSARELTLYSAMWPLLMFALAAANLYIGLEMSQKTWDWFLGIGSSSASWILIAFQYLAIRIHVRSILRKRGEIAAPA